VWEPQTGDIVLSLDVNDRVFQLEFSPDGTMLAAALANGPIAVWDASPGKDFASSKLIVDLISTQTLDEIVRQENWSRLRDVLQQSVERSEKPSITQRYDLALINAYLSSPSAYSQACRALLSKLDEATSTEDRFFASWACALLPTALTDYTDALRAAQTAIERNLVPETSKLLLRSLGALYLRSGNLQKAIEVLEPIVDQDSQMNTSTPYVHFLLALTYHAMNDSTQARRYCEEANRRMETELLSGDVSWNRRLTYKIFQREANQAIFGN
jgi:tetratricopeptide (TPR) repeat protein